MQISKKVPFENENVLLGVRGLYIFSNLLIAGIYYLVQIKINKKNGVYHVPVARESVRSGRKSCGW